MKDEVTKKTNQKPQDFGKVCLCTHKHATHLLADLQKRIEAFQLELYGPDKSPEEVLGDRPSGQSKFDEFSRETENILRVIKKQPFIPQEQDKMILIGSGPIIRINNSKPLTYFYDNARIGNSNSMISRNSPIGEALWKKEVGYKGTYVVNKTTHNFEVVEILPYSQAKKIFPSTGKAQDNDPTPEPGPAIILQDEVLTAAQAAG